MRNTFPVLNAPDGCAKTVPVSCLNENHAKIIHGQTLSRLAERGGLIPREIYLNYYRLGLRNFHNINVEAAVALVNKLNVEVESGSK